MAGACPIRWAERHCMDSAFSGATAGQAGDVARAVLPQSWRDDGLTLCYRPDRSGSASNAAALAIALRICSSGGSCAAPYSCEGIGAESGSGDRQRLRYRALIRRPHWSAHPCAQRRRCGKTLDSQLRHALRDDPGQALQGRRHHQALTHSCDLARVSFSARHPRAEMIR